MTSRFSKLLKKDIFDEHLFEQMFIEDPQEVTSDLSLLYKSIYLENIQAFHWAVNKVKWDEHLKKLIQILLPKASFKKYYDILYATNPELLIKNSEPILNALIKSYSWSSCENRGQRHEIIEQLLDKGATIYKDILDNMLHDTELHPFLFKLIENGSLPFHKNNFFAEYCKNGSIEGVKIFKNIECNLHYLNELPLKHAAQKKNEKMVRYLIDKEGADPCISNYFIFFALLLDDECSEAQSLTAEMLTYLAKLTKKVQIPEPIKQQLAKNKEFSTVLNYLNTQDYVTVKHDLNEPKRLKI